ncbi:hypothetical protein [Streptomyces europaeiscabiei]|uniref:hypothetical protein n=1 Tax=Streptomyces europaeiscabiei TaxID=146819 RepID=UPI0039A5C940
MTVARRGWTGVFHTYPAYGRGLEGLGSAPGRPALTAVGGAASDERLRCLDECEEQEAQEEEYEEHEEHEE